MGPPSASYMERKRAAVGRAKGSTIDDARIAPRGGFDTPDVKIMSRGATPLLPRSTASSADSCCAACPCLFDFASSCWLTGCVLPLCASVCCTCTLACAGPPCSPCTTPECYMSLERMQSAVHNHVALWKLQHQGEPSAGCPCYMCCGCLNGCCGLFWVLMDMWTYIGGGAPITFNSVFGRSAGWTTYTRRQAWFGGTFALSSKLCIADADRVNKQLLDGPMDRDYYLGVHPLRPMSFDTFSDGKKSFPLALPSGACPMNGGAHATFHSSFGRCCSWWLAPLTHTSVWRASSTYLGISGTTRRPSGCKPRTRWSSGRPPK